MAATRKSGKKVRRPGTAAKSTKAPKRRTVAGTPRAARTDVLFAPVKRAERKDLGHVQLEVSRAGAGRVKRIIYPAGFRWSVDMKPVVGTDFCMHAHVGFLVAGAIRVEYPDGCADEYAAPQVVAIEPGHDGTVVGDEPAVLIEFDFEGDTIGRLGMHGAHAHA